jgi:hypothetical protein
MINLIRKIRSARKLQAERRRLGVDLKRRDLFLMIFWGFTALRSNKALSAAADLPLASSSIVNSTTNIEHTLSAFLDTLIPHDKITPSATAAGVTDDMLTLAGKDKLIARLIMLGCQWLDLQTQVKFSELPDEARERILEWMSHANGNSLPRKFFDITRHMAMGFYYRKPAMWKGLPVTRPPQPFGYPDFHGVKHDG